MHIIIFTQFIIRVLVKYHPRISDGTLRCFVMRQLLLQNYTLSSVKFPHLKLQLCEKLQIWGMLFVKRSQNSLTNLQTSLTYLQKFFSEKCLKSVPTYSDKQAFPVQKIMPRWFGVILSGNGGAAGGRKLHFLLQFGQKKAIGSLEK